MLAAWPKRKKTWSGDKAAKKKYVALSTRKPAKAASSKGPSARNSLGTSLNATFSFFSQQTIDPADGVPADYRYDLNSLFDPDESGIGHQPTNYDQLMAIFEEYCVYAVKYKVQISNATAGSVRPIHGVTISDRSESILDTRRLIENGVCDWNVAGDPASGQSVSTFTGYVDLWRLHGFKSKSAYLNDSAYWGTEGGRPSERAFLYCFAAPAVAGNVAVQLLDVEITFYAQLRGTKINNIS